MKNLFKYSIVIVTVLLTAMACRKEAPLRENSIIQVPAEEQNDFDKWLTANFVVPYNIQIKYRYDMNETATNYRTIPAEEENSIVMAHLIKYLCIDAYDEAAGIKFTQHYFPKLFVFLGEWEYNNAGTIRLGTAEGGKKVTLTGLNYLPAIFAGQWGDYTDPMESVNHYYIKTIHHEFTHILNQTKDYPKEFKEVTPTTYVADSWNDALYRGLNLQEGYISTYARNEDREDFAELMSLYITNTQEWWDAQLEAAAVDADGEAAPGADYITVKIQIVKNYMLDTFGIDLDELRDVVIRRQNEVESGMVDLTSLDVN